MHVKIALAVALIAALAGTVFLLGRTQDAERRALMAEQAGESAAREQARIREWAQHLRDSLGQALRIERAPDALELDDSVNWPLAARSAQASAMFWHDEAQRAKQSQMALLEPHERAWLQSRGLSDPVTFVREDLMRRPDLIPFEGVMGGRMQFVPTGIAVLSPEWVFARFEDGHMSGSCLLAYDVLPNGEVSWRRIAARQD